MLAAIALTTFVMWPQSKEFTAVGDIVSVEELGIDGSVYFTYVESGITRNRYEEISVYVNYKHPSFVPLTEEEVTYWEEAYTDGTDEYKEETIENAVAVASQQEETDGFSSEVQARINEIIGQSEGYYGDSMGLMIAIGLYEELHNEDFSFGGLYRIAGTGTMEGDQTVGSIGAIREKLLTAQANRVDYFFIPKDRDYYYDETFSNEYEAEQVIKEENLTLNVIPVGTLQEAILFLESLQ